MLKQVSGYVKANENIIGDVTGEYIDESNANNYTLITKKQVGIVALVNDNNIGSGSLEYDDYVAYDGGGTRKIELTGFIEGSKLGTIYAVLDDEYSEVVTTLPATAMLQQLLLIVVVIVLIIAIITAILRIRR